MDGLLTLFGRLHPAVVHLPIGILLLLAAVELVALFPRGPRLTPALRTLVLGLGAAGALVAVIMGLLLANEGGYDDTLLARHRLLGLAVAALAVAALGMHLRGWRRGYAVVLMMTVAVLGAAGHFGGSLTHGAAYLTAAPPGPKRVRPSDPAQALVFSDVIHPILQQRCASCHGATKHNGDLRLDTLVELMRGGKTGPVFKAGDAHASLMMKRIWLPLEAKEHMPPKGKPQLTEDEAELLGWWIDAGGPVDQRIAELNVPSLTMELISSQLGVPPAPLPDRKAMLRAAEQLEHRLGVLIRPLTNDGPWLAANARMKAAGFGDDQLAALAPIAPALQRLDLGETAVTDAGLPALAAMKNLRQLHLDRTAVTDRGLARFAPLGRLEYLNLFGTNVTDAGLNELRALPRLRSLYLWGTKVTPAALAEFAQHQVDPRRISRWQGEIAALEARIRHEEFQGNLGEQMAVVVTPAVATPLPSFVPAVLVPEEDGAEPAKVAVNPLCPVSGEPVDPSITETADGKVVAFCCEDCREKFRANPGKYPPGAPGK